MRSRASASEKNQLALLLRRHDYGASPFFDFDFRRTDRVKIVGLNSAPCRFRLSRLMQRSGLGDRGAPRQYAPTKALRM